MEAEAALGRGAAAQKVGQAVGRAEALAKGQIAADSAAVSVAPQNFTLRIVRSGTKCDATRTRGPSAAR